MFNARRALLLSCALAVLCLTGVPQFAAGQAVIWHVTATSTGGGGGANAGVYQDNSSGTSNPAHTDSVIFGDSVQFDWAQVDCTVATQNLDCEHSATSTTGLGNSLTSGLFDSGIHTWSTTDPTPVGGTWVSTDSFRIGPAVLTPGTFFYECFVHGPPMEGQITVASFGTANHFVLSPSTGTPTAGVQFTVTVTAKDRNNNTVTNYNNALSFSSSDGSATFSLNTNWSNGVLIENVTLTKSSTQSVGASNGSGSGSVNVNVQATTLDHFTITGPATATQGSSVSVDVTARDTFNNVETNYSGTVHFTSSDLAATLPSDSTLTNGNSAFGVIFNTIGTQTLTVNDTVTTSAQGSISIIVNSANCLASDKTFTNSTAISIPDVSAASPFPSQISVSMPAGQVVGNITVTLHGIHHTFYSDIDILLVGPGGQRLTLQSFAGIGENASVTPIELTYSDAATAVIPASGISSSAPLTAGIYKPTAYSTSGRPNLTPLAGPYPVPQTAGTNTLESTFAGINPNGTWSLYIRDNVGGDSGAVDGGWSITITPAYASPTSPSVSFSTTGAGGTATTTPYPSTVSVSGLPGNIAGVSLVLNNLTINSCSADVAYLLQAPSGQFLVPISLAGPCFSATSNVSFTVSDSAAAILPVYPSALPSGLFTPNSYIITKPGFGEQPSFATPAPGGPYSAAQLAAPDGTATLKNVFSGIDPNGTWSLYVSYQPQIPGAPADTGQIAGGWGLRFELQCPTCNTTVNADTGSGSSFNQSVTFTGTTSSSFETPGGNLVFCDGSASGGTCSGTTLATVPMTSGAATFQTSGLSVGTHTITTNFAGDSTYPPSTSTPLTFTVAKGPTQTSVNSGTNPSTFGQSVTFTSSVVATPFGGSPTGTVSFKDGASTLGGKTLSSGSANFSTAALSAGTHTMSSVYNGDSNFATSTSSGVIQTVDKASTTIVVGTSGTPSSYGSNVTFTATVSVTAPGAGSVSGGTVTFMDGATTLGTGPLNGSNQATFSTTALGTGPHSVTAVYAGAANFNGSSSGALTQQVNKQATSTTLLSSRNPAFFGQSINFTAAVSASPQGASAPTGNVIFCDGAASANVCTGTTLATIALDGTLHAVYSCASPCALSVAGSPHSIKAIYNSDKNYSKSTSGALSETINQAPTTSSVSSAPNPSVFGQSVTITASVASNVFNGGTPSGNVTFCDGAVTANTPPTPSVCAATTLGTAALDGTGNATFNTSSLSVSTHNLSAIYGGDSNFVQGDSDSSGLSGSQVVNKAATLTSLVITEAPAYLDPTQSLFHHQMVLTATATVVSPGSGTPNGNVVFKDGGVAISNPIPLSGGTAAFTLPLGFGRVGKHSITASYNGSGSFTGSTSAPPKVEYAAPKPH